MNANLTVNALAFVQQYSEKSGSFRQEVSRGMALPTTMKVSHQDYVDSATKLPGKRSVVRFDRHIALTTGKIAPISVYTVVTHPTDGNVTSAEIESTIACMTNTIQEGNGGLGLGAEIFANKEQ